MKLHRLLPPLAVIGILSTITFFAPDADAQPAPKAQKSIVVALQGTAQGQPKTLDLPGGPVDATCFQVDLINLESGRVIGSGADCLTNIQPLGAGVSLTDYTIFDFPSGSIVSQSEVSIQPAQMAGFPQVSHLTGSHPMPWDNNVLMGTRRFRNATGQVRLSGGVDMSKLASDGQITFDCIFVITLD